jgi:hypothetical protein
MGNTTLSQRNLADHDRSSLNIPGFRPRTISPSNSRSTEFECTVCGDTFPASEFPQLQACSHNPRVCRECFSGWLISQVGHTSWNRIVCPSDGCGVLVGHDDMKKLASEEMYTRYALSYTAPCPILTSVLRYDELSIRIVLSDIPNFRHCLRAGYNSRQIHDSGAEGNIFRCIACDFLVCTTHDEAFHAGETCEKYDRRKSCERRVDDDASAEKIAGTTKGCPGKGCGISMEKNNGCDHMKCKFVDATK